MAKWWVIETVTLGTQVFKAGQVVDDTQVVIAPLVTAGLELWPATDTAGAVQNAVTIISNKRGPLGAGMSDLEADKLMREAVDAELSGGSGGQSGTSGSKMNPTYGTVTITGLLIESATTNIAALGSTQGTAAQLTTELNKVTTATGGSAFGVMLPASVPGLTILVENHSGVAIQVYGAGTDTIDDVATATGVSQMDSSVVLFTCYEAGKWYSNGLATGYARNPQSGSVLETMQFADALTAAGASQATGLQLVAMINNVTTAAAGTGVNLPASSPGLQVIVMNNGANSLLVYPAQGASDTINGAAATVGVVIHPGTTATFSCTAAGAWFTEPASPVQAVANIVAAVDANTTLTAAQITGAVAAVDTQISGGVNWTAGRNLQLPTVASMLAAMHAPTVGSSFRLRITNAQGGAFSGTVTTNTGWTLNGTMTIAQNTWREFVVTITSVASATATIRSVATGTFS